MEVIGLILALPAILAILLSPLMCIFMFFCFHKALVEWDKDLKRGGID